MRKNLRLLGWHNFLTDFRLFAPVAILYYTQVSGSYALGMSIFSIIFISQALFEIPTGIFSDLVGRAKTVTYGSLAITLGMVCYAVGANYWWLVLGAILEGLSRACYSGNNDALLHDTLSLIKREENFADKAGKLGSLFQVAVGISALVGGITAQISFSLVMWLSVAPQILAWIISLKLVEPKISTLKEGESGWRHLTNSIEVVLTNTRLKWATLASALGWGAGEAIYQFNAVFVASLWPVWAVGLAKSLSNAGAAWSFYTAGNWIKKLAN